MERSTLSHHNNRIMNICSFISATEAKTNSIYIILHKQSINSHTAD